MRRPLRLLAVALPLALAAVPVALAGPDQASGDDPGPASGSPSPAKPGPRSAVAAEPRTRSTVAPQPAPRSMPALEADGEVRGEREAVRGSAGAPRIAPAALIVRVRAGGSVSLRRRPGGAERLRLGDRTEFGSARRLGVVRRRGRWLAVTAPELPNGTVAWVDRRAAAVRIERTRWSIHADVSDRTIVLRRAGRAVRRLRVAVGRPGSPTPTGRFAVTDKLAGASYSPYYGCCILAISATQPHTPPGWTGGNRMAIHGTTDPASIGAAASAGCLRAADADLSFLIDRVPLGTPVVIRR